MFFNNQWSWKCWRNHLNNRDFRCVSLQLLVPGLCIRRASREGCASISSISVCIIYRHVQLIKCISASTCAPIYRASKAAWVEPPRAALLKTSSPPSFRIHRLFVSVSHLLKPRLAAGSPVGLQEGWGNGLCSPGCLQFAPKAIPAPP